MENKKEKNKKPKTIVYAFGCNEDGQLGLTEENGSPLKPEKAGRGLIYTLPELNPHSSIKMIDCGSRHTIALLENYEVYSWGWGGMGQLGHGDGKSITSPRLIEYFKKEEICIYKISAGGCHSGAVDKEGKVYTWGDSSYGQLGYSVNEDANITSMPYPRICPMDFKNTTDKAIHISCGGTHTAVITEQGRLYTWGRADNGQIGNGKKWIECEMFGNPCIQEPTFVEALIDEKIVQVSCGAFHTAAIAENGKLFTWGKEDYGMIGVGQHGDIVVPTEVVAFSTEPAKQVSCGGWHTAVVTQSGDVYAFGRGEYGRLGLGDLRSRNKPEKMDSITNHQAVQISCGGTHTLIAMEDGSVYSVGRIDYGRLGHRNESNTPTKICFPNKTKIISSYVAAGGAHSMVVVKTL